MIKYILKKYLQKFDKRIVEKEDAIKFIIGKQLCFSQKQIEAKCLTDIEFKVFSQWGEDGIIEYLVSKLPIQNKFFIEFGVENYNESNTRFLMMNRNWGGIVIDGSNDNIEYIKNRDYFWKYNLNPIASFITKENINELIGNKLKELKIEPDIGLLSVDIDGVDYWVLKEIDCIDPMIIVCEYNSIFGNTIPVTVPYDDSFVRSNYHYSNLYWGANLKAFENLLHTKGYVYIGSNSQNLNAFFVKKEVAHKYLSNLLEDDFAFEKSKIRESLDKNGQLNHLRADQKLVEIETMELIRIDKNEQIKVGELR